MLLYGVGGFGNANNVIGNRVAANVAPLRPQLAQSVEAMVSSNVLDKVALEGAAFVQQIADKIEFVQYGANFRAANQGEQLYAGAELKARGSLGRFSPFAQGTYEVPRPARPTAPRDLGSLALPDVLGARQGSTSTSPRRSSSPPRRRAGSGRAAPRSRTSCSTTAASTRSPRT